MDIKTLEQASSILEKIKGKEQTINKIDILKTKEIITITDYSSNQVTIRDPNIKIMILNILRSSYEADLTLLNDEFSKLQ